MPSPRRTRATRYARRPRSAFTLIEVLVVVVIIAVLASIVAPNVFKHVDTAKNVTAQAQISTLGAALDAYRLDNGRYPTTEQGHLKTLDARTGEIIYEFGYDGAGRTATLKERNAQITTIERAPDGTLQAIVAPNGQRTTFRLDANQNLRAVVRLGADSLAFSFSAEGALQSVTAPDGTMTAGATYDSAGALLSRTTANLGTIKYVPATGTSSSSISITDATGAAASIVYRQLPSAVRETRSTVFSGAQVVQSVSPDGTRSTTYPNGMKEAISEAGDPQYQLQAALTTTVVTTPSGLSRTVRLSRGVAGSDLSNPFDVFSSTDSVTVNGRTTIARTDPVEGVLDITGPGGKSVHIDLDDSGRPVSVTEPGRAPMAVSFDALGRLSTITTGTRVSSVTYNAQGHTETRTDPEGRVERFSYDAANRLKTRQFPGGRTLSYTYDAAGHLSSITPSGRPATLFAVNAAGRVERYEPFSNGDGFGRLLTTYDSTGREVLYRRADGRERSMLYAPASPDFSIVTSDGDTARFNHSATTLALTSVIYTRGASVTYSNDGALVTGRTWAGPVVGTASYRYDSDFRVIEEKVNGANAVAQTYDADGGLASAGALTITRDAPTGLVSAMQVANVRTVIATSAYAELDSLSSRLGSTPLYSVTMQRDKLGRITSKRESLLGNVSDFTFSYDSSGQLIDVIRDGTASEHYEYDSAGNRVRSVSTSGATVGTYDDHDRLITYGASQFSYSPAGEQALKVVGTDTTAYYYNVWGQLRSVKLPNGTTITYTFDGEGRRVGKAVNGVMVRKWLYRGPRTVIAELDGQNVLIARFVYGGQIAPEYMVRGGTTYRLLKDERGSVRAVVDATTGVAAQTMSYDAFGRVLSDSNPDFQPFGFSGGLYDAQTGLTNFDARDYDASIGRWLTLEPLSFEGGDANLYRYALADPINNIDPTGTAVVTEKATAMAVEGEVAATAATTDAAAIQIEREFTRQMRRDMCEWGANTMMAYEAWKHVKNKDGFQGHHPARQADMIRVLGSEVYDALQDWVVPIFGSAFKRGTPHYDATQAQAYAWGLGWGVTASAAYGLHAAGCSPEAIRKIMDTFLAHHKDVDLKDDQPKPND